MRRVYLSDIFVDLFGVSEETGSKMMLVLAVLVFLGAFGGGILASFKAMSSKAKKKFFLFLCGGICVIAIIVGLVSYLNTLSIKKAERAMANGDYATAIAIYESHDMFSELRAAENAQAEAACAQGDYDLAIAIYEENHDMKRVQEVKLARCKAMLEDGYTDEALDELMIEHIAFPEAVEMLIQDEALREAAFAPGRKLALPTRDWSYLYETRIYTDWGIVAVEDGKALLINLEYEDSAFGHGPIEVIPETNTVNYPEGAVTWEHSSLREELQEYYEETLAEELQSAILLTENQNQILQSFEILPGNPTEDYIFVLSEEEIENHLWYLSKIVDDTAFLTRTPAEGTEISVIAVSIASQSENEISLTAYAWKSNHSAKAAPVMWVDIDLLLDALMEVAKNPEIS